jgi:hypothetical protein
MMWCSPLRPSYVFECVALFVNCSTTIDFSVNWNETCDSTYYDEQAASYKAQRTQLVTDSLTIGKTDLREYLHSLFDDNHRKLEQQVKHWRRTLNKSDGKIISCHAHRS